MTRQLISGALIVASSVFLGAQSGSRYDRAGEQVYTGTIKALASFQDASGNVGVHLDLKTEEGRIVSVHVAPAMFIGMQNVWFFADDVIEVIGSKVVLDDNVSIWAKAIQKGNTMLAVRNTDGTPKWTGDDGIDGCGVNHLPIPRGTER